MRTPIISILIYLIFSVATSCTRSDHDQEVRTVFRYNESAGISSLDPAFTSNQANIWAVNQIFNGLVQLDDSLVIRPCIARSWKITGNGCIYTFYLRNDVYFHKSGVFGSDSSRLVNASDFVYSFKRITDPATASPGAWIFNHVALVDGKPDFTAIDDTTFQIRLKRSFPPFLGLLSMQFCSVVPYEAIRQYGKEFRQHPIGTGPFQFKLWKEGVKLVLLRNPDYFEKVEGNQLPFLDAVAVTFIADKQSAFLEFVKGNLDFMSGIDASYKDELLTPAGELSEKYTSRITLQKSPYLNTEYLGFQIDTNLDFLRDNPLRIKKIRQAINYGFDRDRMMLYLRNSIGYPGIYGMIPAGLPGSDQRKVKGYGFEPLTAKRLLKEAGFPNGKDLPPITLSTNASYLDLCKYIQSQLNELGFSIRIDVTPPATLREMIAQAKVPFFRGSWIADYPDAENYLSLFYSRNFCPDGPNYTHFSSKEFDRLYDQACREINDSVRGNYYIQMDNLVMSESPVVILYYDQVLRFTGRNIQHLGCNPLNLLTLKNVRKTNE
jgi:peptide/nickel transport system substrate-binding protein